MMENFSLSCHNYEVLNIQVFMFYKTSAYIYISTSFIKDKVS